MKRGDCKCVCGHCRKDHFNGKGRCTICLKCPEFI